MEDLDLLFMLYLDCALEKFEMPVERDALARLNVYRTAFRAVVGGALQAKGSLVDNKQHTQPAIRQLYSDYMFAVSTSEEKRKASIHDFVGYVEQQAGA